MVKDSPSSYHSDKKDSKNNAEVYKKITDLPFRYLAYRDLPDIIRRYIKGKDSLDFGCGTGISTQFLVNQGFSVTAVDSNEEMIKEAKIYCPLALYWNTRDPLYLSNLKLYDLVFSSFVLFELSTETDINTYLSGAKELLKEDGVLIAITGSQYMYSKNWICFKSMYEDKHNFKSGDKVKIFLPGPDIEFTDYYWIEEDYKRFFKKAGFILNEIYYPLGKDTDPFVWKDEKIYSPFVILVAQADQNFNAQ